jgi:DNA mismatch endonuclease (patch repair protein)
VVRQRDTRAELVVRNILWCVLGARYRTRNRDLPGSPDIANRSRRWAVFVHGCFWHHHRGCYRATIPKRNRAFWLDKFQANRARDARALRRLRRLGFRCLVVWECQIDRDPRAIAARLRVVVRGS